MASVDIRAATAEDCGLLAALLSEAFAYYGQRLPVSAAETAAKLRRHLGVQPGFEALLAEQDGYALGFAIYAPVFWTSDCEIGLFLKEIYVTAKARHQGVGRALMAELARIALARDWTRMVWTVDRNNRPALRFYQSLPGASEAGKHLYMQSGRALRRLAEQG